MNTGFAIQFECQGRLASAGRRKETKEQKHCTALEERKEGSVIAGPGLMKGEVEHRAVQRGAGLATTECYWERGLSCRRCLLFWSDWSGLRHPAIVPRLGADLEERKPQKRWLCQGGIRLRG